MQLHRKLLILIYPLIYLKNRLKVFLYPGLKNQVRVLLYHDISSDKYEHFAFQLTKLKKYWNFITPEEFASLLNGQKTIKGRNLLLTFDDGFISNKLVAQKILKPLEIKAIFFVIPNFINISDNSLARQYVADYIYPSLDFENVPTDWTNMNWDDLEELIKDGHTIGAHTMSHAKLSAITEREELETEIVASAEVLEHKLRVPIQHFAFPFGNIDSFSYQALNLARGRFNFIHSGLRGNNDPAVSNYAIRRDSVTPNDHLFLISSFLNGAADFRYYKSASLLDSWANSDTVI